MPCLPRRLLSAPSPAANAGRRRLLLGSAAAVIGLPGCGGGNVDDDATLRAVNATSDLGSLDLRYNDWLFAGSVSNGAVVSGYARRKLWVVGPAGLFEVTRAGGSTSLLSETHSLPQGDTASVVVMGSRGGGLRMRIVDEDAPRPGNQATRLRVLHALPSAGALDVYITAAGQALSDGVPDVVAGGYEDMSHFVTLAPASRLRITAVADRSRVLFDNPNTGLAGDQVVTLVVAPAPGPSRVAVTVLPADGAGYVLANHAPAPG